MKTSDTAVQSVTVIPQSSTEAAAHLIKIAAERRALDEVNGRLNRKVEELKADAMTEAKPHQEELIRLIYGLYEYAKKNREILTEGGKTKTVELPTGSFGWRFNPPSVSVRKVKEVIKYLRSKRLTRFIRVKEEVDKKALGKSPKTALTIKGVTIKQEEVFVVTPNELRAEIPMRIVALEKLEKKRA